MNDQDALSVLTLRPLPTSEWLTEDSTGWSSRVNLPMPSALVQSVRLNGKALDYVPSGLAQIVVWPKVPREAGRLTITFMLAETAAVASQPAGAAAAMAGTLRAPPAATYGLSPAGAQV